MCLLLAATGFGQARKGLFAAGQTGSPAPSFLSGALGGGVGAMPDAKPEADKVAIRLSNDVLGKEFMLQAAYTEFEETPKFHGLKSRIVTFKKHRGKLYMIEANAGNTGSTDLPTTLLLAEFPIVSDSDGWIEIDWGAGMKNVFFASEMHASDVGNPETGAPELTALNVRFAFVDSATVTSDAQIIIRQIAQLDLPTGKQGSAAPTVEIKYYLTLYQPDATFKPSVSKGFHTMGFFEVAPQLLKDGGTVTYASKFNASKPITFAVSANTPPEYRQAIKDGILYWNKVFGEERMKAVDAPDGIVPPDFNLNIVQWINYETAGSAYADAQMDPRTGEILHAQIYLPSSFAIGGKEQARQAVLRSQASAMGTAPKAHASSLNVQGHAASNLCNFEIGEMASHSVAGLESMLLPEVPDSQVLKASQDMIRAVVAHEVGHTLGMRHNFAGSLASTLGRDDIERVFAAYLKGTPSKQLPSSTVMDYLETREAILLGDLIGKGALGLDYDKKAIASLYKGKDIAAEEMPPFCTDSALGKYIDCMPFDSGKSIVASRASNVAFRSEQVAQALLEAVTALNKTPMRGSQPMAIERISVDPQKIARFILGDRHLLFAALTDKAAFLSVRRGLAFEGPMTQDDTEAAESAWLEKEFAAAGGVSKVFAPLPPDYADKVRQHWNALLADKRFTSGKRKDGSAWAYTDADLAKLHKFGEVLFGKLGKALVIEDILIFAGAALGGKGQLIDSDLSRDLATELEKRATAILTATVAGGDEVVPLEGPMAKFFADNFADVPAEELPRIAGVSGFGGFPTIPMTPKPGAGGPAGKPAVGVPVGPGPAAPPPAPKTIALPKFTYPLDVRRAAASLLSAGRCQAPEWGLGERIRVRAAFLKLVQGVLQGKLPAGDIKPDQLPRQLIRWIIEFKTVDAAIGA